jgi:SHS2 domain-containing protein
MKRVVFITLGILFLTIIVKTYAETKNLNFLEFTAIRLRLGNPPMPIVEGNNQEERFVNRCLALAEMAATKDDTAAEERLQELARNPYRTFLKPLEEQSYAKEAVEIKPEPVEVEPEPVVEPEPRKVEAETVERQKEPEITKEATLKTESSKQAEVKSAKTYWFEPVFASAILVIPFLADLIY